MSPGGRPIVGASTAGRAGPLPVGDAPGAGGTALRVCLGAGLLAASLALAGCGGDGSFAPGPPARVEGRWSYSATLRFSGGGDCVLSGATLRIEQTSREFRGFVSEFSLRCGEDLCRVAGATFTGGSVRGEQVEFRFLGLRHAGQVTADIMRGAVTAGPVRLDCVGPEGRTVPLEGGSGDWTARL